MATHSLFGRFGWHMPLVAAVFVVLTGVVSAQVDGAKPPAGEERTGIPPGAVQNFGAFQVYRSGASDYARTTPFRLQKFAPGPDGRSVVLHFDTTLTDADKADLERYFAQDKTPTNPNPVARVRVVAPYSITVTVMSNGVPVGKTPKEEPTAGGGFPPELVFGNPKDVTFTVQLDPPAQQNQLGGYEFKVVTDYVGTSTVTQEAMVEVLAQGWVKATEDVFGVRPGEGPKPGDYITREGFDRIQKSKSLQRTLTTYNASPKQQEEAYKVLERASAEKASDDKEFEDLERVYTIWTVATGRLDIKPKKIDNVRNKDSVEESLEKSHASLVESMSDYAKTENDFNKWYKKQQDRRSTEHGGSVEAEADIMDIGSGKGKGSYTFKEAVENLTVGSAEGQRYRELKTKLADKRLDQDALKTYRKASVEGVLKEVSTEPKQFRLYRVTDHAFARQEITKLVQTVSLGRFPLPIQFVSARLDSAAETLTDRMIMKKLADLAERNATTDSSPPFYTIDSKGYFTVNLRGNQNDKKGTVIEPEYEDIKELIGLKLPIKKLSVSNMAKASDAVLAELVKSCGESLRDIDAEVTGGPQLIQAALARPRDRVRLMQQQHVNGLIGLTGDSVTVQTLVIGNDLTDVQIAEVLMKCNGLQKVTIWGGHAEEKTVEALKGTADSGQNKLTELKVILNALGTRTASDPIQRLQNQSLHKIIISGDNFEKIAGCPNARVVKDQ